VQVDSDATPTDVRRVARVVWRRKAWVILPVLLAVAGSLFMTRRAARVYAAASRVSIAESVQFATVDFAINSSPKSPEREMATQLQIVTSPAVVQGVRDRLGTRARRISSVRATPIGDTDIIGITVQSTDPSVAADGANSFADVYISQRRDRNVAALNDKKKELDTVAETQRQQIADLDAQIASLDKRIAQLQDELGISANPPAVPAPPGSPEKRAELATLTTQRNSLSTQRNDLSASYQTLKTRSQQLDVAAAVERDNGAQVIAQADVPSKPISPQPRRDAALAAAFGLVLGLGLGFGRDALDDRIRFPEDLERAAPQLSVLASIPKVARSRRKGRRSVIALDAPNSAAAEAYRSLRTGIEFARTHMPLEVIVVTSAVAGEGKSTTAVNLAVSLAQAGFKVVLIDGDFRRPALAGALGVDAGDGLTSVLLKRNTLDQALQTIPLAGEQSLKLLAPGPVPANPSDVLAWPAVGAIVDQLKAMADYVIIDTPPVLPLSDALVVARWADGVLLSAHTRVTRRRRLDKALDKMEQGLSAPILGVTLNAVRVGRRHEFGHAYYHVKAAPVAVDEREPETAAVV
jgi:capsular exopolysaccharide synthesis family protein